VDTEDIQKKCDVTETGCTTRFPKNVSYSGSIIEPSA